MAIISQQQQDEANGQQQPPNGPTQISGTSAGSGTGQGAGTGTGQNSAAAPVSGVAQNQAPQASQGYTDVASYLDANQQGSQQLGNQVASNLTSGYNTTKQGIDTSAQAATQAANSGYTPTNESLISQVAANPTAAAADPNQLSAFQGQLNDTYSGPNSWTDMGTQQGNANIANQNAGLTKTPGGLNVLTSQVEQNLQPGHTSQGINQLDTMLLGGSPGAMSTVQSAADPYSTLNDYINQQNTNVTGAITAGQTGASQASQDALNAFTGANGTYTNLNNAVNKQSADALAAAQSQQAGLKADIGNLYGGQAIDTAGTTLGTYGGGSTPWGNTTNYNVGQLSPQDLAAMGITQDQWNTLQGAMQTAGTSNAGVGGHNFQANTVTTQDDLSKYLNMQDPTQAISAATTATPEQYAQMSAIQQLLGSKAPQGAALNPLNSAQAGSYNPATMNNFDYNAALQDVQNYNTQAQQDANQMSAGLTSGADLAHAQSQHGGGLLGGLQQAALHPLNTIASGMDPMTWAANAQNISKGQGPNPTNFNPTKPTTQSTMAHGGEVPEIDKYLDAKKVK